MFIFNKYINIISRDNDIMSHGSVVGIATVYGLEDRGVGFRVQVETRVFTSPYRLDRLWGLPSILSNWYRGALSPRIKLPAREVDHSPPNSAEFNKMQI
jgi:hypothetical protein